MELKVRKYFFPGISSPLLGDVWDVLAAFEVLVPICLFPLPLEARHYAFANILPLTSLAPTIDFQMGLMPYEAAFLRLVDKLTNGTKVRTEGRSSLPQPSLLTPEDVHRKGTRLKRLPRAVTSCFLALF